MCHSAALRGSPSGASAPQGSHLRVTERRLWTTSGSHPLHRHRNLRAVLDGLVDHAIALGEFQEQIELVLRRVGLDVEAQANLGESNRRFLVDTKGAAKIEIAF